MCFSHKYSNKSDISQMTSVNASGNSVYRCMAADSHVYVEISNASISYKYL